MAAKHKKCVTVTYHFISIITVYRYTCVYYFKVTGINKQNLPNKEYTSCYRCKGKDMVGECKIFVTVT